ncbi:MAG: hypothetical protein ACREBR_01010 [bacterium]
MAVIVWHSGTRAGLILWRSAARAGLIVSHSAARAGIDCLALSSELFGAQQQERGLNVGAQRERD